MHDVIIVGARCAGSSIAILLARRGYRVLLVDRDTFPSDMPMSTHFIHQRGVACLARWGLRNDLVATKAHPVTRFDIDVGQFTLSGSAPRVDGEAAAFAPRRILLDDLLVQAATSSGAVLREGCEVDGLLFDGGRVAGITGRTQLGARFSEPATLVIGADGPSSRVAASVQAEEYNSRPAFQGTAWIYWEGILVDHLDLHLRNFEGIYAFPTSGSSTLIGANWSIDRFRAVRARIEASYFEVLQRAAPNLADEAKGAKRADDKIYLASTRNFFRKAHGPGWVLLGDAHCTKDPNTAQGITDAFCDAEVLAEAIDRGFSGKQELGVALAEYERARVDWVLPFYDLTCQLATFAPPPPDMLAIYAALQGNQEGIDSFIGLITEATRPGDFFAPENVQRILAFQDR